MTLSDPWILASAAAARRVVTAILAALACAEGLSAQELEPRRWGHLPLDSNFAGIRHIRSEGDIACAPLS